MDISERLEDPPLEAKRSEVTNIYDTLVNADNGVWNELDKPYQIQLTGALYNLSEDLGRSDGLDRIIELHEQVIDRDLADIHEAIRYYQLANVHSLRAAWSDQETTYTFFDSDDLIHALGYARASVAREYQQTIPRVREAQSYVNFANLLSQTGRVCEALIWYNRAIDKMPEFGMALGNRAQCKMNYAALLFSDNHTAKFLHSAYKDLERALENSENLHHRALVNFQSRFKAIEDYSDDRLSLENEEEYELGETTDDEDYHRWVLEHNLYINPLNDISTHTCTAHDYFHLPNMFIPEDKDFPYPGLYNQFKQEFVSARYLYYEGITRVEDGPHHSDRDVKLPDTFDYTVYGYRTEQIKNALRTSYSIFDKIAVLINEYFEVGQSQPSFHHVWHQDGEYSKGLAEPFKGTDNWALNALYWIKKDFHHAVSKKDEDSVVVVAHELRNLRTAIEHDYIKVFDDDFIDSPENNLSVIEDTLYDAIGKTELRQAALEMLRLARAAIIYVSLAIHHEEQKKKEELDGVTVPIGGDVMVPDEYKE